jgi:methylated-DNA-[protein]-cysteine S-methyltransferase
MFIYKKEFDSNIGRLTVLCNNNYIINLSFANDNYDGWLKRYFGRTKIRGENEICARCEQEISQYLSGKIKSFTLPYKLFGTPFELKIWNALTHVAYGETVSYARIACLAGLSGNAARAAAGALSRNPIPIIVPCHRVIYSDGRIGGYCGGHSRTDIKKALLSIEGVIIPS